MGILQGPKSNHMAFFSKYHLSQPLGMKNLFLNKKAHFIKKMDPNPMDLVISP